MLHPRGAPRPLKLAPSDGIDATAIRACVDTAVRGHPQSECAPGKGRGPHPVSCRKLSAMRSTSPRCLVRHVVCSWNYDLSPCREEIV